MKTIYFEQRLKEVQRIPTIKNTMNWNSKQASTYEDNWRNFLNQVLPSTNKRVITLLNNISEL